MNIRRLMRATAATGAAVLIHVAVAGAAATAVEAAAGTTWTIRVSVGDGEQQTSEYRSEIGAVSSTGRYAVFTAAAPNLATGDVNETWDAFVRDWLAGTTTLVSATAAGTPANSSSYGGSITSDGRLVMFSSTATDLRDDDDDGDTFDVYIRDMRSGSIELASVNSRGTAGNGSSHGNVMTSDGRYVAFASTASNLAWGDSNGVFDVFLRDRRTRQTSLVSTPARGGRADGESTEISVSADGRYAAFTSAATNLVPGDTNGVSDVFVRDLRLGSTRRISVSSTGAQADGGSHGVAVSADGRFTVFVSEATNLVPGDTNGVSDVFVRDLRLGSTRRVSVSSTGAQADGASYGATVNADGRYVTFTSDGIDVAPGQVANGVFLRDRWTGRTTEVSVSTSGARGGGSGSSISADGRYVGFNSNAPLVPDDTNADGDAFLRRVR